MISQQFWWPSVATGIWARPIRQDLHECQICVQQIFTFHHDFSTNDSLTNFYLDIMLNAQSSRVLLHHITARSDLSVSQKYGNSKIKNHNATVSQLSLKNSYVVMGLLQEIVTDHGPKLKESTKELLRISWNSPHPHFAYNSQANGLFNDDLSPNIDGLSRHVQATSLMARLRSPCILC